MEPSIPFFMVLNYNPVLSEIVKSVIGSLGMFASIPLTALVSVKLYSRYMTKKQQKTEDPNPDHKEENHGS